MGFVPTNKVTQQAIKAVDVVPATLETLVIPGAVLYIGTGGNIKVDTVSGDTVTFKNVADGSVLAVQVKKVYNTGTSANDIIALY
jgi:hypothetical protein|tara:strand:- start:85 stop:339 length:255 start_codon:yes stop_codon:yes gene_type:complete